MTRRHDWELRLYALHTRKKWLEFDWGSHDCCTFAADATEAVLGQRVSLPGPYGSARQALRTVRALGGLPAAVTGILGTELGAAAMAQRGDIVLLSQPGSFDGHALAVCYGEYAHSPGEDGLVAIHMKSPLVLGAWRIGR